MNIKRNIIFAPESRKKDGIPVTKNVPIRMRVIFASQRIEFTTGYRIDVEKWDTDKQRVRNGCTNKLKQSASEINAELLRLQGESIVEPKYSRALGIVGDWIYVADTIANLKDDWDNQYMNVYAINSKGEIKNKIENVSCFYPLSQYIIMAENEKYYFANKKGNPVDNNSYYKISVPPFTNSPSYSSFWSSLIAPHSLSDYDAWGVVTNYIDEKKTLASIFDKLTSDGIDSLKMGQPISRIMDLYNIKQMPASGMVDLHNRDWGINQVFATYSVGILYECKCVIVIKVEINANASPIGDNPQKLFDAIPQYLTETLGLKREDENLYRSKDACYDIVYCKGENSFFLMSKAMTEE